MRRDRVQNRRQAHTVGRDKASPDDRRVLSLCVSKRGRKRIGRGTAGYLCRLAAIGACRVWEGALAC